MREELTTAQIAVRADVSERSVQQWIKSGRLPAEHLHHNRYRVESEDIERLRLGQHYEEGGRLALLETRMTLLEHRMEGLAAILAQLTNQVHELASLMGGQGTELAQVSELVGDLTMQVSLLAAQAAPPARKSDTSQGSKPDLRLVEPSDESGSRQGSSVLPDALVSARSFALAHGTAEGTIKKAIHSGRLPVVRGRWKVGRAWVTEALDQEGRAQFLALYHDNAHFHECDDPQCLCHEPPPSTEE